MPSAYLSNDINHQEEEGGTEENEELMTSVYTEKLGGQNSTSQDISQVEMDFEDQRSPKTQVSNDVSSLEATTQGMLLKQGLMIRKKYTVSHIESFY